jgi:hypothetical protein
LIELRQEFQGRSASQCGSYRAEYTDKFDLSKHLGGSDVPQAPPSPEKGVKCSGAFKAVTQLAERQTANLDVELGVILRVSGAGIGLTIIGRPTVHRPGIVGGQTANYRPIP